MASITFVVDLTEGHIYPSFGLAQSLLEEGHTVTYMNIPGNEDLIRAQGFGFYPVLGHLYPKGRPIPRQAVNTGKEARVTNLLLRIGRDELDAFFKAIKPDLLIVNGFLCIECLLLYYRYGIRPVILTTYLRKPGNSLTDLCIESIMGLSGDEAAQTIDFAGKAAGNFRTLRDFTRPLSLFPELILCPQQFEKESVSVSGTTYYIEPSIRAWEENGPVPDFIPQGKKIVYASFGSHTAAYGDVCIVFYRKLIDAMRDQRLYDVHLVLSVGKELDPNRLGPLPSNITALPWVSQIPVIKASTAVITHGGLGTIKECIYFGVPMIVIPITHDQPRNGSLVEFHGMGISQKIEDLDEERIVAGIRRVLDGEDFVRNVKKMQNIFRDSEESRPGRRIIGRLLAQRGP
jgi:MGT family glycosyltransferase